MIIGLTGGLATGKTTIATLLKQQGYIIIDADEVTHELYETSQHMTQIIQSICPSAVQGNTIIRHILAECVTRQPELLSILESQTHPFIINRIKSKIKNVLNQNETIILVAPLLFETGLHALCDVTICLYADIQTQHERAMKRSNMTTDKFTRLIKRQWGNDKRMIYADYVVSTDTSPEETYQAVLSYLQHIQQERR